MTKLEDTLSAEELRIHNARSLEERDQAERQFAVQQTESEERAKERVLEYQEANKAFRQVQNPTDFLADMQREMQDELRRLRDATKSGNRKGV